MYGLALNSLCSDEAVPDTAWPSAGAEQCVPGAPDLQHSWVRQVLRLSMLRHSAGNASVHLQGPPTSAAAPPLDQHHPVGGGPCAGEEGTMQRLMRSPARATQQCGVAGSIVSLCAQKAECLHALSDVQQAYAHEA